MRSVADIAALIDHTLLRPDATEDQIRKLCREAKRYGFAAVCVNSSWVPLAFRELGEDGPAVCSVVGFPLGAASTATKVVETGEAVDSGAREIDVVMHLGLLASGNAKGVLRDIEAVVEEAHRGGALVKVILETALLTDEQKEEACSIVVDSGAEFVKTSTGFHIGGATVHDVELLRNAVGPELGVKASGGIRTLADFTRMLAAGATRIGSSSGVEIVEAAAA